MIRIGNLLGNTGDQIFFRFPQEDGGNEMCYKRARRRLQERIMPDVMDQSESLRIVFITTPDLDTAESIANALLEKRLAACVNIFQGLRSMYHWEGKIEDDQEILLMIKTRAELLEKQLIPLVQKLHPYQVPEIIALPIVGGGQSYLDWILSETGGIESHNLES